MHLLSRDHKHLLYCSHGKILESMKKYGPVHRREAPRFGEAGQCMGGAFQLILEMKLEVRVGVGLWYDALLHGQEGAMEQGAFIRTAAIMGIDLDSLEDLLHTTLTWIPVFHNDTHLVSRFFFPCEMREVHALHMKTSGCSQGCYFLRTQSGEQMLIFTNFLSAGVFWNIHRRLWLLRINSILQ